jgi:retron-type reverse transcriptase
MVNPLVGVPQGSIISPILSNLYLNELDKFMEAKMKTQEENRVEGVKHHIANPQYTQLSHKISLRIRRLRRLRSNPLKNAQAIETTHREYISLLKVRRKTRSVKPNPLCGPSIKYARYADD